MPEAGEGGSATDAADGVASANKTPPSPSHSGPFVPNPFWTVGKVLKSEFCYVRKVSSISMHLNVFSLLLAVK